MVSSTKLQRVTPPCQLAYGRLNEENIMRRDAEETAKMVNMDMVINVLVNFQRDSTDVYAGDIVEAQRRGG
ncbi:MAG: hypothetical protein Q6352_007595 [Candidatus Freyrarchaeum guaymaensis]|nr:hypothetical protein [Candidatus Sigynarchaeota archaeon]